MIMDIRNKYPIEHVDRYLFELIKKTMKDGDKTESPLIVIQGGYGKNNLGDDALLYTINKKILEQFPKARIVALCHYPDPVFRMFQIKSVAYKSFSTLKNILSCDALIIGGGGIVNVVNTYSGFHTMRLLDLKGKFLFVSSLLVKLRRKPVIFYGVGVTSIPDVFVGFLLRITMKRVDLALVRDPMSYSLLDRIGSRGLFLSYDPALDYCDDDTPLWDDICNRYKLIEENIVISIRAVPNQFITSRVVKAVAEMINYTRRRFPSYQIVILPISCHPTKEIENDCVIGKRLVSECASLEKLVLINEYLSPKYIKKMLSKASTILMSRLHGLVLSYDFSIPTIVLSYNEKVSLFAKMAKYRFVHKYEQINAKLLCESIESILTKNYKINVSDG